MTWIFQLRINGKQGPAGCDAEHGDADHHKRKMVPEGYRKILIRVISYARLESETKKISGSMERLFPMGYKNYSAYHDDCLLMFSVVIFSGIL